MKTAGDVPAELQRLFAAVRAGERLCDRAEYQASSYLILLDRPQAQVTIKTQPRIPHG